MSAALNVKPYVKADRSSPRLWEIRDNAETRKLSAEQRAAVTAAIVRHNDRSTSNRGATTRTGADMRGTILAEVTAEISPLVQRLYRTAAGRWAGGETTISIRVSTQPAAGGDSTRAWSNNGKWRGLDAHLSVAVMPAWRMYVRDAGLATVGGLLTTHAKPLAADTWAATWIEQNRGFDIKAVTGVIYRTPDGDFIHAASMVCVRQVLAKRARAAAIAAQRPEVEAWLRSASVAEIVARYGNVAVTRTHSLAAGNCVGGTDSWISRHLAGRTSATVAELAPIYGRNRDSRLAAAVLFAILKSIA